MSVIGLAWERFSIIARIFGDMQARVIATILYFTLILPFGLLMRRSDTTFRQTDARSPRWQTREPVDSTLDGAMRQG